MASDKPKVIVTRKLPESVETRMMELFDTTLNIDDAPMARPQLQQAMQVARVLVPTITDTIDSELIESAGEQLELIANFGNGTDNIDIAAATAKNIAVTNTPKVLTSDTADMIMAMMLAIPRRLVEGANVLLGDSVWSGWAPNSMLGESLCEKRLGIVGMGRIGSAVASRAKTFGMSIHYHNRGRVHPDLEKTLEATYWQSLDQMLARMDIISINCPYTPASYHLLSRRRLQLLQGGAYIVNAARAEIIDESALIELLEQGKIAGAALDVFEHVPEISSRLKKLAVQNKVLILPHMASATVQGRIEMGDKVIINIRAFLDGHRAPDRVLPAK